MVEFVSESVEIPYLFAMDFMKSRTEMIANNIKEEMIWFLSHPNIITRGLNAKDDELLIKKFPVIPTNRGGKFTYHGVGQRIIYVMLDLKKRNMTIKNFVYLLEEWVINVLSEYGITANRSHLGNGVFVGDKKISAIGLRVHKNISYHGISLNVFPDLENFNTIIPCGILGGKVTSMKDLGIDTDFISIDNSFIKCFNI